MLPQTHQLADASPRTESGLQSSGLAVAVTVPPLGLEVFIYMGVSSQKLSSSVVWLLWSRMR